VPVFRCPNLGVGVLAGASKFKRGGGSMIHLRFAESVPLAAIARNSSFMSGLIVVCVPQPEPPSARLIYGFLTVVLRLPRDIGSDKPEIPIHSDSLYRINP
jgi:hypothetical protein